MRVKCTVYIRNPCSFTRYLLRRTLRHRNLLPWLNSLNWKHCTIDKWYTNETHINCCQMNYQTNEISTRSTLHPYLMIQQKMFWKHEKNCNASTFLYTPNGDLRSVAIYNRFDALWDWKEVRIVRCIVGYILPSFQSHNASNLWYFAICNKLYGLMSP